MTRQRPPLYQFLLAYALFATVVYGLSLLLQGCGGEKAPPKLSDFVQQDVIDRMEIVRDENSAPCELARKQLPRVQAITLCHRVYLCELNLPRGAELCLLVHEAHHVEKNGKNYATCLKNIVDYDGLTAEEKHHLLQAEVLIELQRQNSMAIAAKTMYRYGASYYIGRLIERESMHGAYEDIAEEREARSAQDECLASF